MLCENLVSTQRPALDLTVNVRATNLDLPQSEEQLRDRLLAHAMDCHECLAVVLFGEDLLSDSGCSTYREMFAEATRQLRLLEPVDPAAHLTEDLIEALFFDKLSDEQMIAMAAHVDGCPECARSVRARQGFYLSMRASLESQAPARRPDALHGIVGVNAPEADIHLCLRLAD
jgi:hypothetical protein